MDAERIIANIMADIRSGEDVERKEDGYKISHVMDGVINISFFGPPASRDGIEEIFTKTLGKPLHFQSSTDSDLFCWTINFIARPKVREKAY